MKRAILGCSIIKEDIESIISELDYKADVFWMDEKLHNIPENLRTELQAKIDELADYDEIIITYCLCGNGLLGIKSNTSSLLFIRGDDCIYADMCHRPDYKDLRRTSMFLSRGWLSTDRNPKREYEKSLAKYGETRTRRIYDALYRNYKHLVYMKMEDRISEETMESLKEFARIMNVDVLVLDGSIDLYRDLLELRPNEKIIKLPPGMEITLDLFLQH